MLSNSRRRSVQLELLEGLLTELYINLARLAAGGERSTERQGMI